MVPSADRQNELDEKSHFGIQAKHGGNSKAFLLSLFILSCMASIAAFLTTTISTAFVCLFVIWGLAVFVAFFFEVFPLLSVKEAIKRKALKKRIFKLGLAAIAIAFLLEALTIVGTPQASILLPSSWSGKRILFFFLVALMVGTFFSAAHSDIDDWHNPAEVSHALPLRYGAWSLFGVVMGLVLIAAMLSGAWRWTLDGTAPRIVFLVLCSAIAVGVLVWVRNEIVGHLEYLVAVLILVLGSYLSIAEPPLTAISLDDQIHYDYSVGLSYFGGRGAATEADDLLCSVPWVVDSHLQFEEFDEDIRRLDEIYDEARQGDAPVREIPSFSTVSGRTYLKLNAIGRAPAAVGIWFGRMLQLPFSGIIICGRLFTVLVYAVIIMNAVRIAPKRKLLLAVIALLPTNIYLAANFSYDPWLNAWIMLGVASTMRESSRREEPIVWTDIAKCAIPLLLGLCVKAVYFPIIAILFIIPASRFPSRRSAVEFRLFVVLLMVVMAASFLAPILIPSAGAAIEDSRAPGDVNAARQLSFAIEHPLTVICIIAVCALSGLLVPTIAAQYTCNYSYMAIASHTIAEPFDKLALALMLIILLAVIFDQDELPRVFVRIGERLLVSVLAAICIGLSVGALYLSFTPVGSPMVAGWQPRYLLAVLYPLIMPIEIRIRTNKKLLTGVSIGGLSIISIICDVCSIAII
jgi:uncharacterized membrane protein